jgi:hypothetical protein
MSQMGQKRKWPRYNGMSVVPSRADIVRPSRHVRFVPRTDSATDSATVLNLLLTGSCFAGRSVLAIGDWLAALIGLASLAVELK